MRVTVEIAGADAELCHDCRFLREGNYCLAFTAYPATDSNRQHPRRLVGCLAAEIEAEARLGTEDKSAALQPEGGA